MLLVVDIGNTSTTLGVFYKNTLKKTWKISSDLKKSSDEYGIILKNLLSHSKYIDGIKSSVISSVVLPLTEVFKNAIENYVNSEVLIVSPKINTGLQYNYDKPKEIGADRIANAYAAYKKYGKTAIVVDFGTATTFDIVTDKGVFEGGIICPGIGISAESLNKFTSLLPKVRIDAPEHAIGKNTIDAMLSGLVRGHAAMIEGLITQVKSELVQPAITIATGGYSNILTDCMKQQFDYFDKYLTLDGLRLIQELNFN